MKPVIRLCDFFHIINEQTTADGRLIVTGVLHPQDMTAEAMQRNAIVAKFNPEQGGPRGSWETMSYQRRSELKAQATAEPPKLPQSQGRKR